jgi:hypothetical protein
MGAMNSSARAYDVAKNLATNLVEHLKSQIQKLSGRCSIAEQRRRDLASERTALVPRARIEEDAASVNRMQEIDTELMNLDRDIADDTEAIKLLKGDLAEAENDRAGLDWENERRRVRKVVVGRINQVKKGALQSALDAFIAEISTAQEADKEISTLLLNFDPNLKREARAISAVHSTRRGILTHRLLDPLEIEVPRWPMAHLTEIDLVQTECRDLERALQIIDSLELIPRKVIGEREKPRAEKHHSSAAGAGLSETDQEIAKLGFVQSPVVTAEA